MGEVVCLKCNDFFLFKPKPQKIHYPFFPTASVNDAPVAAPRSFSTNEDTLLSVSWASGLLSTATDVDGPTPVGAVVKTNPQHSFSFQLFQDGSFLYTPAANYNGQDTFTYAVLDAQGLESAPATVTITISAFFG
jgi:hypothetical protein